MLHGTWKVTGGGSPDIPVIPVAALVLAAALAVWLATVLLILAVVALVLLGVLVAVAVMMRRRYPDYSEALAGQAAAIRADVAAPKAAPAVVNHYHLHVAPGTTAEGVSWAIPLRDAATKIKGD